MKKFAIALIIFASSLCAQVQLSKNVQVGGNTTVAPTVQTNGVNNTSQTTLNHVDTTSVKWSNPSGGVEQATVSVQGGVNMNIVPPVAGQYVVIYPTSVVTTQTGAMTTTANNTSAQISYDQNCSLSSSGTATWSGFALPSGVLAANVTAVYAFGFSANTLGPVGGGSCINPLVPVSANGNVIASGTGSSSPNIYGTSSGWTMQQFTGQMVGLNGANVSTAQIQAGMNVSGDWQAGQTLNVPLVGLIVYYTGSAPPASTTLNIAPPLYYNPDLNVLGISPDATFFASKLFSAPQIKNLPLASANTGALIPVQDGSTATDCTTGGGTNYVLCRSDGSVWTAYSAGGGSLSGMTAGQVPIAATASTVNSSKAIQGTDTNLLSSGTVSGTGAALCTDANGGATTTGCPGGGSGTVSGQASGVIPLGTSATVIGNQSHLDDGVSAPSTITSSEPLAAPSVATGSPSAGTVAALPSGAHGLACDESTTAGVPIAGTDYIRCNATTHQMMLSVNGGAEVALGTGSGTVTTTGSPASGDIAAFSGSTSITTATATQVNTLIKTLTGCNTSGFVYVPQSGTCVAPTVSALTQIAQVSVSSPQATISFTSIPGTYSTLRLVLSGQNSGTGNNDIIAQFNSDSGTDYGFQAIFSNGSSAPGGATSTTSLHVCGLAGTTGSYQGVCEVLIPGYTSTTFKKTVLGSSTLFVSSTPQLVLYGGNWGATAAAITRIDLTVNSGTNFEAGTVATLYGVQ